MRRLPPGACDSHIHVFGPYDRFPLAAERSYTPPEAPLESYLNVMRTLGLERVVIVHGSAHGLALDATVDAVARLGERARGIAVARPDIPDSQLDRLDAVGFRGLRVVTVVKGGVDPAAASSLARRIERLGWHLQLLVNGPDELLALAPQLRQLPVPFVIDSFGRFRPRHGVEHPGFRELLRLLETGRCWVKLTGLERRTESGPPYADVAPLAKALIAARPDRIVWGSDWPHVMAWDHPMPADCDLLNWLLHLDIPEETRNAILVVNPQSLYGFAALRNASTDVEAAGVRLRS
jgi:predicted TIM-barrel fold metal-dependent hydrolase